MTFFKLVDRAKRMNSTVARFEDDLREYADLRNAIVHHRTSTEYVIAEPHDSVVEDIERIDQLLSKPLTVGDFFRRKVTAFQAHDSLEKVLEEIKRHHFTQFPVFEEGEFVGLLTTVGIAFWLAENHHEPFISREIMIREIVKHEKSREISKYVTPDLTVYQAEELFKKSVMKGKRLEALLIRDNNELVGIVTPIDLMKIEE
ncbi:CBS domain-containing protein [Paenisporosarcina cavernae]|uniref:CBS domain-containing protein n=2 Tax=Paenisporosarcina cavernae TaxID=2320858 RepID=A0A385YY45_9BACL|nr:CBS domain-containing protein [Paenisporosarcina cavernae]